MTRSQPRGSGGGFGRALLACALAGLAALLLVPLEFGGSDRGRVLAAATNAAHFPLFYLLARGGFVLLRPGRGPARSLALAAGALVGLIAAAETLQPLVGRSSSWEDAGIGALGAAAGLLAGALRERGALWPRVGFHAGVLLLFGFLLRPPLAVLGALEARERRFPQLGSFEEESEGLLWEGAVNARGYATRASVSRDHASEGSGSLRVVTAAGKHQGVAFAPGRGRWDGFSRLALDVFNPGAAFLLDIDILDRFSTPEERSTHFHRRVEIAPGWNALSIPVAEIAAGPARRRLLLSAVRRVLLLTGAEGPETLFYVDNLRLLREVPGNP